MAEPTLNQTYHLVLADIAVAMALSTFGDALPPAAGASYVPGQIRDRWLSGAGEPAKQRRISALANAGIGALQRLAPDALRETAARYGIAIDAQSACRIAEHFELRRTAVLRYRR